MCDVLCCSVYIGNRFSICSALCALLLCENFWRWLRLYSCYPAGRVDSCVLWCSLI